MVSRGGGQLPRLPPAGYATGVMAWLTSAVVSFKHFTARWPVSAISSTSFYGGKYVLMISLSLSLSRERERERVAADYRQSALIYSVCLGKD